jgi:polysaccharide chain length determinant protein (PEP-CTERM system associated)
MAEDLEEKPSEGLDWQLYFDLARRHAWHFLIPFFLGWLVVWTASWFMPSVYRSGTLILIEEPTVPEQFVVPNIGGDLQARLQSITQQILSRTRLLHIIDQFNLYAKGREHGSSDAVVERMRKDIEIELIRSDDRQKLTSFNVYYSADDPKTAQAVTSELTNLFISENLEFRQQQSQTTTKFLEDQMASARRDLMEQEEKVREFKSQYLGQLPGQLQSNLQILAGYQNQLQAEQDALSRARQQNSYLESLLSQYRSVQATSKSGDGMPLNLPAVDQELERLRAQLADLSAHYTDKHPDVKKVKQQIAKTERLKQQIMADLNKPRTQAAGSPAPKTSADFTENSPMFQVQSQLNSNNLEIEGHEKKIRQLQEQIGQYQGRLNEEPVREQQLADLTRGYEQSKADYDSLLKKKNESELATNLELQQQGEHFRILDPPDLPVKPHSPNRLKLFGIGLFAGLVLGVVVSGLFEISDDRIFSEKQLKKMMPASVLIEIPPIPTLAEQSAESRQGWFRWAGAGTVLASILLALAFTYLRG